MAVLYGEVMETFGSKGLAGGEERSLEPYVLMHQNLRSRNLTFLLPCILCCDGLGTPHNRECNKSFCQQMLISGICWGQEEKERYRLILESKQLLECTRDREIDVPTNPTGRNTALLIFFLTLDFVFCRKHDFFL